MCSYLLRNKHSLFHSIWGKKTEKKEESCWAQTTIEINFLIKENEEQVMKYMK